MSDKSHKKLVIPGPVEVRPEVLEAQTAWMFGHRSKEFAALFERLQGKLQRAFDTQYRVYVVGASGTGLWEGASRCAIRDDKRVLHCTSGAFSERWAKISQANGKQVDVVDVPWGQAIKPEMVEDALKKQTYDAVAVVHNETSTGVLNPIPEIGEIVSQYEDTLFLVDTVSGILGAEFHADAWNIDVALTSSQKAFALPPGLAFASVSDRVLQRAEQVEHRGYYFDFLNLEKYLQKNNTPSTPPISLMHAAERQLDDIFAGEGIEGRVARHHQMMQMSHEWALSRGFGLYAEEGYRSPTITSVANTPEIDVYEMETFMAERGFAMDKGYGAIRGETFRIAHMGDLQPADLEEVFAGLDEFIGA